MIKALSTVTLRNDDDLPIVQAATNAEHLSHRPACLPKTTRSSTLIFSSTHTEPLAKVA